MKRLWVGVWGLWFWAVASVVGAQDMPAHLAEQIGRYGDAGEQVQLAQITMTALQAGADARQLEALLDLALTRSYAADAVGRFIEAMSMLRAADIPEGLVRGKILEGMAKRVPTDVILAVAQTWTQALRGRAAELADLREAGLTVANASVRETLINLGTVLTRRYAMENPLRHLAQHMPQPYAVDSGERLALAAQLLETLLLNGASQAQALALVETSLAQGLSVAQLQKLQFQIADQLRQGFSLADILSAQQKLLADPIPATQALPRTLRERTPDLLPGGGRLPTAPGQGLPGGIRGPGIGVPGGGSMPGGSLPGGLPGGGLGDLPLHNVSSPGLPTM